MGQIVYSFSAHETFRETVGDLCQDILKSDVYRGQMHYPNDRKHATLIVRGTSEPRVVRYTVVEPINELLSLELFYVCLSSSKTGCSRWIDSLILFWNSASGVPSRVIAWVAP